MSKMRHEYTCMNELLTMYKRIMAFIWQTLAKTPFNCTASTLEYQFLLACHIRLIYRATYTLTNYITTENWCGILWWQKRKLQIQI